MAQIPPAVEQVLRVHAGFIHAVVNALRDRSQLPDLMKQLDAAEQAGWARLVGALRHVVEGRRDPSIKLRSRTSASPGWATRRTVFGSTWTVPLRRGPPC